ncbi:bud site selection protein 21-like [Haliotis rufescens]|uniref:bud site selection protein 21-like n=1 Tax=Haliotis rufescens TaxID=6454 RepID=UPI00201E97A5|nr:bud site selection protein 21-like [Haliotis rufescens]
MPRQRRALTQRQESDDEFETPAFRDIGKDDETKETEEIDSEEDLVEAEEVSAGEGSSDEDLELAHDDVASDEDDSDAAPEDVGFSETRATALSQMRQAMTQIKEEKLQLKAKRKQRDEKFKEQKRIKLEAVSRLPDEILNSLPEKLSEEKKETDKGKQKKKEKKKHEGKKQDLSIKKQSTVFEETEDYLPLKTGFVDSETGIKAMPLKDLRKRMAISQSAANFRNSRLYGDHRRRESTQAYLAKMEKRKVRQEKR